MNDLNEHVIAWCVHMMDKPDWAIDRAHGQLVTGAHLATRDGRRVGNAHVVVRGDCHPTGKTYFRVITDAGTWLMLSEDEIKELFHKPQWVADIHEVLMKFGKDSTGL